MAAVGTSRRGGGPGRPGQMMDDGNLTFDTLAGVEVVGSFDAMGIRDELLRGIYSYGFEKPSALQQRVMLPIITGRDVITQAQSRMGKTSMISLSICQIVDPNVREKSNKHYPELGHGAPSASTSSIGEGPGGMGPPLGTRTND